MGKSKFILGAIGKSINIDLIMKLVEIFGPIVREIWDNYKDNIKSVQYDEDNKKLKFITDIDINKKYKNVEIIKDLTNESVKQLYDKVIVLKGEYTMFSNSYNTDIIFRGIKYTNAEAAFQSMKTLDIEVREHFSNLSAKDARQKSKEITQRQDWHSIKYDVMYDVCLSKFSQNSDLFNKLLDTKNAYLENENNWGDTLWGTTNGQGKNMLGSILMSVRDELSKY